MPPQATHYIDMSITRSLKSSSSIVSSIRSRTIRLFKPCELESSETSMLFHATERSMSEEKSTEPQPDAAPSCVPSSDHAMLKSEPTFE